MFVEKDIWMVIAVHSDSQNYCNLNWLYNTYIQLKPRSF